MRDTRGFTLVELLAVIVILAVVMLMAVTAVAPLMTKSRKGALGSEGLELINSAKTAYQLEQMSGNKGITSTSTVCFSINYLNKKGYFEKGNDEHYHGSVLVKYENNGYTYTFWISDGTYAYNASNQQYDYDNAVDVSKEGEASDDCGGQKGLILCKTSGSNLSCSAVS